MYVGIITSYITGYKKTEWFEEYEEMEEIYTTIIATSSWTMACKRKEIWRDVTREYSQERSNVKIWCCKFLVTGMQK